MRTSREVGSLTYVGYAAGFLGTGVYLFLAFSWYCLAFLPIFLLLHFRGRSVKFGKVAVEVLVLLIASIHVYICLTGSFLGENCVVTLPECIAKRLPNYALFVALVFAVTLLTTRIDDKGLTFVHADKHVIAFVILMALLKIHPLYLPAIVFFVYLTVDIVCATRVKAGHVTVGGLKLKDGLIVVPGVLALIVFVGIVLAFSDASRALAVIGLLTNG